jgi:hypothetical protein
MNSVKKVLHIQRYQFNWRIVITKWVQIQKTKKRVAPPYPPPPPAPKAGGGRVSGRGKGYGLNYVTGVHYAWVETRCPVLLPLIL